MKFIQTIRKSFISFCELFITVFDKTKIVARDSQLRDHSLLKESGWLARVKMCVERGGGGELD